jgi:hypothetical protein
MLSRRCLPFSDPDPDPNGYVDRSHGYADPYRDDPDRWRHVDAHADTNGRNLHADADPNGYPRNFDSNPDGRRARRHRNTNENGDGLTHWDRWRRRRWWGRMRLRHSAGTRRRLVTNADAALDPRRYALGTATALLTDARA